MRNNDLRDSSRVFDVAISHSWFSYYRLPDTSSIEALSRSVNNTPPAHISVHSPVNRLRAEEKASGCALMRKRFGAVNKTGATQVNKAVADRI